jgi:tetratricopeptide (TPR) repeat protein
MTKACAIISAILFWGIIPTETSAQEGRGHVLYGDLKADESKAGMVPQTYTVVLSRIPSGELRRVTIPNGGRYRFNAVQNGEYNLIVEVEGQEVVRIPMLLQEGRSTDIRRDIELAWKADTTEIPVRGGGAGAALYAYARPEETHALFRNAQEAMGKKDFRQAAALLVQITGKDPEDFEAWTELGTSWFNVKKLEEAEEAYRSALEHRPGFLPAQLNLGKIRLARKNYEGAVDALSQAVQNHPDSAEAQYYLGESYLQAKRGSKAAVHLNEALRLDPVGKADAHLRLGALYNAAGMKDRAASEYEQFLTKVPNHPDREKLRQYIRQNKK